MKKRCNPSILSYQYRAPVQRHSESSRERADRLTRDKKFRSEISRESRDTAPFQGWDVSFDKQSGIWLGVKDMNSVESADSRKALLIKIISRKRKNESNPHRRASVHCPTCNGEGRELGALGYLRHFNCRDCGAQFSKKARAKRRSKVAKNPAYRTRASTKKIIGAWLRARGGKGALRLGKIAGRRMRIGMDRSGNWVTKRKPLIRSKR